MEGLARVRLVTGVMIKNRPVTNIADLGIANKARYTFKK